MRTSIHFVCLDPKSILAALLAIAVVASVQGSGAQPAVPPTAALDVQIPLAPIPVKVGGRWQLAYELHITNYRTADVILERIDVTDGEHSGSRLASYDGEALVNQLARVGTRPDRSDKRTIGAGMHVVVFIWLDVTDRSLLPSLIRHRISYRVATKDEVASVETGAITVQHESPVVLAPPLRDGPWTALYDPSNIDGHRRALFAMDGRARIPGRFAIDWVKLGDDGRGFHGDRSVPSNYYGYGADVLAVADGVVANAVDRFPEPTLPITLDNEAGNYLAINIGGGRFAFFEHLQPHSVRVRVGDRVRSGDVLARVGASGSVFSGPHLHFHVSDANSPLGAEGLPFVFKSFEVLGSFESIDAFARNSGWTSARGPIGLRTLEMPSAQSVLRFHR
jgi:hypothetical protein